MSDILNQTITMDNIFPYAIALTDKEIQNARVALYNLKKVKNILPTAATATPQNASIVSKFADIPASISSASPLLSDNSVQLNYVLSERTAPDVNTFIPPFNDSIGLMDDPLNMQKNAFDMFIKLQNDKINNVNAQLSKLEEQKRSLNVNNQGKGNNTIKSVKNTVSSLALNVDEYNSAGISTNNYGGVGNMNSAAAQNNQNYYLLFGNNGCLKYDSLSSNYSFTSCDATNPQQQFAINPINNARDYNKYKQASSAQILDDSSIKFGFNVITPGTDASMCVTGYPNGVAVEPCTIDNNQRFTTFRKPLY